MECVMIRNYIDGFGIKYRDDRSEFLLDCFQLEPIFEDGSEDETAMEEVAVARLKLSRQLAENLYTSLKQIFDEEY